MVNEEYKIAYTQVLEILNHIPKIDYEKIDKGKIEFYQNNKKEDYVFNYDVNKTLDEQGVSKIAKAIIAIIYRDYWASEEERNQILEMQEKVRKRLKDEMQIDFNPTVSFKSNNEVENKKEDKIKNKEITVIEKQSIIKILVEKIKKLFNLN